MKRKELIQLIKSGNFTIAYHDMDSCDIYAGRKNDYEKCVDSLEEFEGSEDGYIPTIVEALVEALGGKVVSV